MSTANATFAAGALVNCPNCGIQMTNTSQTAGRRCQCNSCRAILIMPALGPSNIASQQNSGVTPKTKVKSDNQTPGYYNAMQVFAASFVGGALAGGTLMALNLVRMGKRGQATLTMFGTLIATILLIGLCIVLAVPSSLGYMIGIGQGVVMMLIAKAIFADEYAAQEAAGIKHANRIGEACLVIFGWIAFWTTAYFALLSFG